MIMACGLLPYTSAQALLDAAFLPATHAAAARMQILGFAVAVAKCRPNLSDP
jgi:hypothetical protein